MMDANEDEILSNINIEINKVIEVRRPRATVPPKSEAVKMTKPANRTNEV